MCNRIDFKRKCKTGAFFIIYINWIPFGFLSFLILSLILITSVMITFTVFECIWVTLSARLCLLRIVVDTNLPLNHGINLLL